MKTKRTINWYRTTGLLVSVYGTLRLLNSELLRLEHNILTGTDLLLLMLYLIGVGSFIYYLSLCADTKKEN